MNIAILAALSIFVTPEGEHQWRFVADNKDPKDHTMLISREMGYQRLCPNGWEVLSEYQNKVGRRIYHIYEGRCK